MSGRAQLREFEVVAVRPQVLKANVKGENVTVMIYLIPVVVATEGDKVASVVSTPFVTVFSDSPRIGERCTPEKMATHESVVPDVKVTDEGGTELKVDERKLLLRVKVTNINVYPDLRDDFGNPCVSVGWIQLMTVE